MIGYLEHLLRRQAPSTVPYTDPLHAGRHPFQTFMLALVVVSSIPLVFGRVAAGSIEETLPAWAAFAWGFGLLTGAVLALVGSFWRGAYDTALMLERIGLNFAGFAAVVYGLAIPIIGGWRGLTAAAITLGFGVSCLIRARDIARVFARANNAHPPCVLRENE